MNRKDAFLKTYGLNTEACAEYRNAIAQKFISEEEKREQAFKLSTLLEQKNDYEATKLINRGTYLDGYFDDTAGKYVIPLMRTIEMNNMAQFIRLLKAGASIDMRDSEGNTPLMRASELGNVNMSRILIMMDADVLLRNKKGQKAYDLANLNHNPLVCDLLFRREGEVLVQYPIPPTEEGNILKDFMMQLLDESRRMTCLGLTPEQLKELIDIAMKENEQEGPIIADFVNELLKIAPSTDGLISIEESTMRKLISETLFPNIERKEKKIV